MIYLYRIAEVGVGVYPAAVTDVSPSGALPTSVHLLKRLIKN